MKTNPPPRYQPPPNAKLDMILGPPGTGKTTRLLSMIREDLKEFSLDDIAFVSFSKAACEEATTRLKAMLGRETRIPNFKTLHSVGNSLARRAGLIQRDTDVMLNKDIREFAKSGNWKLSSEIDEDDLESTAGSEHDALRLAMEWARNRCKSLPEGLLAMNQKLGKSFTIQEATKFVESYEQWKRRNRKIDFLDMLELGIESGLSMELPIVYIDEAQDLSPLQQSAVELWFRDCERMVIAGDDDQCQPLGTMVKTPGGEVPIETLAEGDLVVSWSRSEQSLRRRGRRVLRSKTRPYSGELRDISAGGHTTSSTPDHKFVARFLSRDTNLWVTYLMFREDLGFRVGWCQLFRSDGVLHIGARMNLERADALWILKVHKSKSEASVYESVVAATCGVPTATFEPLDAGPYTLDAIRSIFSQVPRSGGVKALASHGLGFSLPFWPPPGRESDRRGRSTIFQVYAANILPEIMALPVQEGGWAQVTGNARRDFQGEVVSLKIEADETYVSDGIVTHNCIYEFQGCDPTWLVKMSQVANTTVLDQSYRIPLKVHTYALEVISRNEATRIQKEYRPRAEEGFIRRMDFDHVLDEAMALKGAQSFYYLARTNMLATAMIPLLARKRMTWGGFNAKMLDPTEIYLGRAAVDIWTGKKSTYFREGMLAAVLRFAAKPQLPWDEREKLWGLSSRRHRVSPEELAEACPIFTTNLRRNPWNFLGNYFVPGQVRMAIEAASRDDGYEWLLEDPLWTLGTLHGSKGREADVVVLPSTWSKKAVTEMGKSAEIRAAENRLAYVGITRAKKALWVVDSEGENHTYDYPMVVNTQIEGDGE